MTLFGIEPTAFRFLDGHSSQLSYVVMLSIRSFEIIWATKKTSVTLVHLRDVVTARHSPEIFEKIRATKNKRDVVIFKDVVTFSIRSIELAGMERLELSSVSLKD